MSTELSPMSFWSNRFFCFSVSLRFRHWSVIAILIAKWPPDRWLRFFFIHSQCPYIDLKKQTKQKEDIILSKSISVPTQHACTHLSRKCHSNGEQKKINNNKNLLKIPFHFVLFWYTNNKIQISREKQFVMCVIIKLLSTIVRSKFIIIFTYVY